AEHDADYDDVAPSWPHALDLSRTLGILGLMPANAQTPEKARNYAVLSEFWSALDALDVCPFASAPVRILSLDDVAALVRAATGAPPRLGAATIGGDAMVVEPTERVALGSSGVRVTRLGFGTAEIGGLYRAVSDADAAATLEHAWAAGVRYFDSAPLYGYGNA